jgi:hypothetical protein
MGLQHLPKAFLPENQFPRFVVVTHPTKALVLRHWINSQWLSELLFSWSFSVEACENVIYFDWCGVWEGLVHKTVCCLRAWRLTRAATQISMPPNNITSHVTRPSPSSFF